MFKIRPFNIIFLEGQLESEHKHFNFSLLITAPVSTTRNPSKQSTNIAKSLSNVGLINLKELSLFR